MYIYIIFSIFITVANSKFLNPFTDKIDVDLKYIRSCPVNNLNTFELELSSRKYNRSHIAVDSHVNITEIWDHRYEIDIEFQMWGDGGWKKHFFHDRHKYPCERAHLLLGPMFFDLLEAAKAGRKCPIDPGYYEYKNIYLDLTRIPLLIQEGRFYVILQIFKNDNVCFCVDLELVISRQF